VYQREYCYHRSFPSAIKCASRRATSEHRHMYVRKVRKINPSYPASRWSVRISR
jgi:hypothetical protein